MARPGKSHASFMIIDFPGITSLSSNVLEVEEIYACISILLLFEILDVIDSNGFARFVSLLFLLLTTLHKAKD